MFDELEETQKKSRNIMDDLYDEYDSPKKEQRVQKRVRYKKSKPRKAKRSKRKKQRRERVVYEKIPYAKEYKPEPRREERVRYKPSILEGKSFPSMTSPTRFQDMPKILQYAIGGFGLFIVLQIASKFISKANMTLILTGIAGCGLIVGLMWLSKKMHWGKK